ncbi:hypothetical protein [Georgenia alba]|uniref:Secreted protein n=1 Tax=Georgenia alba TaxID=2233858 RepID=A0ABW2Q5B7_9MICO
MLRKLKTFVTTAAVTAAATVTGMVALASPTVGATASAATATASCWDGPNVTDYQGSTYDTSICPTWKGSVVGFGSTDTGYLYAGNNFVVCQQRGGENPQHGGARNDIWLYTQGDEQYQDSGWGWLPATVVSYGGDYQPIPGVPWCRW